MAASSPAASAGDDRVEVLQLSAEQAERFAVLGSPMGREALKQVLKARQDGGPAPATG